MSNPQNPIREHLYQICYVGEAFSDKTLVSKDISSQRGVLYFLLFFPSDIHFTTSHELGTLFF